MPHDPLISLRGERAQFPLAVRVLGRYFVTGAALRGPGDNATFLHRATVDYRARPYVTLTGPKWQRLARRHAAFTVPFALVFLDWRLALTWVIGTVLVAACAGARAIARAWRDGRRHREWTDPAAKVLYSLIGGRYTRQAGRAAVDVPRGWGRDNGEENRPSVRIHIPAGTPLNPRLKQQITDNVGARLGIPSPRLADWREAGPTITADISGMPLPPKEVTWKDLAKAIKEAKDHEVIVGRKTQGHLTKASLTEDSPHFLMSGPAGTGKSVLARVLLVQRLLRGDGVIILDPKRFSHWRWAGGGKLPKTQVIYAYRDEDLHETWLAIGEEIKRRIELPEEELEQQRRVIVCVEEANVQTKKLARYWRGERKRIIAETKLALADDPAADIDLADLDPPVQSPAIVAMQESVCMGRELRMHVLVAAQRASANVFGGNGGDIRESFQGGRFIARWDRKLWKMLVDTIDYVACPTQARGVWGVARGDSFEVFRVPWLTDEEALAIVRGQSPVATGPVLGQQSGRGQLDGQTVARGQRQLANPVTLANAIGQLPGQDGPLAITLATLRWASGQPDFPAPLAKSDGQPYGQTEARLYDMGELIHWRETVLATRRALE